VCPATDAKGSPILNPQATLRPTARWIRFLACSPAGWGVTESELTDLLVLHGLDVTVDNRSDTTLTPSLYRHARMGAPGDPDG